MALTKVSGEVIQATLNVGDTLNIGAGVSISAGVITATSFIGDGSQLTGIVATGDIVLSSNLTVGVATISNLNASTSLNGEGFESYELDDLSSSTNDHENTFIPKFNYETVTITNPFRLMITVNGILQSAFINNTDSVYQSHFLGSNNGYTIDYDNKIKFTESIPTGSEVVVRVLPVSNTATKKRLYPFKPTDILLGY